MTSLDSIKMASTTKATPSECMAPAAVNAPCSVHNDSALTVFMSMVASFQHCLRPAWHGDGAVAPDSHCVQLCIVNFTGS